MRAASLLEGTSPASTVGAVGWLGLLALAALLTFGLQLDRQSRANPAMSAHVPGMFRHFAQVHIARQAIEAGDSERARAEAERLIARRPVAAESLSLLAYSRGLSGDEGFARRTLLVAASRGWRDPLTQAFIAEAALRTGMADAGANRLIALWVMGQRNDALAAGLSRAVASDKGREAIAQWLAISARHRANYAGWGVGKVAAEGHARTIVAASERADGTFSCAALDGLAEQYLRLGEGSAARIVWKPACARAAGLALDDVGLRDFAGMLAWKAGPEAGFAPTDDGTLRIEYQLAMPGYQPVAERRMALLPGAYRMAMPVTAEAGSSTLPARLVMTCIAKGARYTPTAWLRADGSGPQTLIVPAQGCSAQLIQIEAARGRGTIEALRLTRLAAAAR